MILTGDWKPANAALNKFTAQQFEISTRRNSTTGKTQVKKTRLLKGCCTAMVLLFSPCDRTRGEWNAIMVTTVSGQSPFATHQVATERKCTTAHPIVTAGRLVAGPQLVASIGSTEDPSCLILEYSS
jgi:hypothetical protein